MTLRILHLVHQYPPHFVGGTELYTQTLARYQVRQGHGVAIFCPYPSDDEGHHLQVDIEEGIQVFRVGLNARSRTQVFIDTFRHSKIQEAFKQAFDQFKPDIVHIQHLMGMPTSLVDIIKSAGVPMIITLHDYWYKCANAQLLTNNDQKLCHGPDALFINCGRCGVARLGKPGMQWAAPGLAPLMAYRNRKLDYVLRQAVRIIAPTRFVKKVYAESGAPDDKITVIKHGLDLPETINKPARSKLIEKRPSGPLQVGYIGGISWQKGLHILIEAVNAMASNQAELTIYGDLSAFPSYVQELRDLIRSENINLAGSLDHDQVWGVLAQFDVLVLPTLWYETSSLILDEAFAVGVPVVATGIGVMNEKIEDGGSGRLFPRGDHRSLKTILAGICENRGVIDSWRENIPRVQTIVEHIREIEDVYHEAVLRL